MGKDAGAGIERGDGLSVGRIAMAERDRDPAGDEARDRGQGAVELGSQGEEPQALEGKHALKGFAGRNQIGGGMRAEAMR